MPIRAESSASPSTTGIKSGGPAPRSDAGSIERTRRTEGRSPGSDWLDALFWPATGVLLLFAYLPVFRAQFIWNDADYVTHPSLRNLDGLLRIWCEPGATEQYYPLLHSFFWLQQELWGDAAAGYHVTNLVLHAVAVLLFFGVLRELRLPGARVAALLFALHPVMVESVAWISEQKNTLSLVFMLSAMMAYLRFDPARDRRLYGLASALFAAALFSKSVAATLPGVLLVVLWWRRGSLRWRSDVFPLVPWIVIGGAFGLFTGWVERVHVGATGLDFDLAWSERLLLAGRIPWFYGAKLAWPADLVFIYPRWEIDAAAAAHWAFPMAAALIVGAAWFFRHRARGVLATLLLFGGVLFPVLGFFPVYGMIFSYVADHWQYHAALAVFAGAGWLVHRAAARAPRLTRVGVAAVAALFAAQSHLLARNYREPQTFYRWIVAKNPEAWMAHNNLGNELLHSGDARAAAQHFETATTLRPGYFDAWNNRALAADALGRASDAQAAFRRAVELNPGYAAPHVSFGNSLFATGDLPAAAGEFRRALRLEPTHVRARYNLAVTLGAMGRTTEALRQYRRVLDQEPASADARFNLAALLCESGDFRGGAAEYRELLRHAASADVHNNLGTALLALGDVSGARAQFQSAVALDPSSSTARRNLALVLSRAGEFTEAARQLEAARALERR